MVILMKFLYVEKISNLQTLSSSNVPNFIKKNKSSWIKYAMSTARPEQKLCYILYFGKKTSMTVKRLFLMRQQKTSYQQKGSKFLYLNKFKPLQLTTTIVMIDSIINELNIPFLVSFYILRCFLDILMNFIFKDCFSVYHFFKHYISSRFTWNHSLNCLHTVSYLSPGKTFFCLPSVSLS